MFISPSQKKFIVTFSLGFATATLVMTAALYWRSSATPTPKVKTTPTEPVMIVSEKGDGVTMATADALSEEIDEPKASLSEKTLETPPVKLSEKTYQNRDENGFQISSKGFSFKKSDWKAYRQNYQSSLYNGQSSDDWVNELAIEPLSKNKLVRFQIQAFPKIGKSLGKLKHTKKSYRMAVKRLPSSVAHALALVGPKGSILVKLNERQKERLFNWPLANRKDLIYEIKRM